MEMYLKVLCAVGGGGALQRNFFVHIVLVWLEVTQKCIFMRKG